jgi:hypothetical protein
MTCVMMSAARPGSTPALLPTELWHSVLSFVGRDWFSATSSTSSLQQQQQSVDHSSSSAARSVSVRTAISELLVVPAVAKCELCCIT